MIHKLEKNEKFKSNEYQSTKSSNSEADIAAIAELEWRFWDCSWHSPGYSDCLLRSMEQ